MNWAYYFFGYDRIMLTGDIINILNFLEYYDIDCISSEENDNGITVTIPRSATRQLKSASPQSYGIDMTILCRRGLPADLKRLLLRPGVIFGILIFCAVFYIYSSYVFDIKFEGNQNLSEEYLLSALERQGFGIGSAIRSFDYNALSNKLCVDCPEISWIFVNVMGNIAYVSVREYEASAPPETEFSDNDMTDLVAIRDGQIERLEITDGTIVKARGKTVLEGEVLVSGCFDGEKADYLGRSRGKVFAKTFHSITFQIDRLLTEYVETEKILVNKYTEILGFPIKLSKKGSNLPPSCDIIRESEKITLHGGAELPIVIHREYAVTGEEKTTLLDDGELYNLAEQRINQEIKKQLPDAAILSIDKSIKTDSQGIHVTLSIYCIENIAKEVACKPD